MSTCVKGLTKNSKKTSVATYGTIKFQVTKTTVKGKQYYEAMCSIEGLKPTKLSKIETGCTLFENKSAIISACNARATKLRCKSKLILPREE